MSLIESAPQAAPQQPAPVPLPDRTIPLVVGVTGHRDPAPAAPLLRAAFGAVLDRYRTRCPHTAIVVLSGLAAGADTCAAEEAMARGIPVIAALAAPLERFALDFPAEERDALRALAARCSRVDVVADVPDRTAGYVAVKDYLIRFSHVLVAFWDGAPPASKGGTADVVHARLTGSHLFDAEALTAPVTPDVGPVVQIVTPRGEAPVAAPLQIVDHAPEGEVGEFRQDYGKALECLDAYNRDLARQGACTTGETSLAAIRRTTADYASRLQARTNALLIAAFSVGFVIACLTVLSEEFGRIVILAIALVIYRFVTNLNVQNRYQDYRALSEALRVQLAWNGIGLAGESVDVAYLKMYQSELEWIRMAIRSANLIFSIDPRYAEPPQTSEAAKWIDGQVKFLTNAMRRDLQAEHSLATIGNAGLLAGGLVGAVPFLASFAGSLAAMPVLHGESALLASWSASLGAAWHALVPAIGAHDLSADRAFGSRAITIGVLVKTLLASFAEHRHLKSSAKRYARILLLYRDASRRFRAFGGEPTEEAKNVVRQLGREALVEQSDWLLARRDRPIEIPQG